jgi:hypothetical protein
MSDNGNTTPISELAQRAREHYERIARKGQEWNSIIPQAIDEWEKAKTGDSLSTRLQAAERVARAGNLLFQFGVRHDDDCEARRDDGKCSCGLDTFKAEFHKAWEAWQNERPRKLF